MIKTQLTLCLRNKPGELGRAIRRFTAARINIEGISVAETTDVGLVQLLVSNAAAARLVLKKAGIPVSEQKVVVLALANKPGELAKLVTKIAREKININYLYATTAPSRSGVGCSVVISADDLKRVEDLVTETSGTR